MHWLGLMGQFGVMNVACASSTIRVGDQPGERLFLTTLAGE